MTPAQEVGAKALMAQPDFRWWDGMADTDGVRVVWAYQGDYATDSLPDDEGVDDNTIGLLDLGDPGTRGCVEAWGEERFGPEYCVEWTDEGYYGSWLDADGMCYESKYCPTKGEALAASLVEGAVHRPELNEAVSG